MHLLFVVKGAFALRKQSGGLFLAKRVEAMPKRPPLKHIREKVSKRLDTFSLMVAGVGLEPHDLRVMSPTSYQLLYPAIYGLLLSLIIIP